MSLARPTPHPVGYAPGLRPFAHTPPRRPLCARCPSGPPARIRGRPPSIITTPIHTHQSPTANAAPTYKNSQKVQMKGWFFYIMRMVYDKKRSRRSKIHLFSHRRKIMLTPYSFYKTRQSYSWRFFIEQGGVMFVRVWCCLLPCVDATQIAIQIATQIARHIGQSYAKASVKKHVL